MNLFFPRHETQPLLETVLTDASSAYSTSAQQTSELMAFSIENEPLKLEPIALGEDSSISSCDSITLEDSEVRMFYDFFYPKNPEEKAMASIFSDDEEKLIAPSDVSESDVDELSGLLSVFDEEDDDERSQSEHVFPWKVHSMLEEAEREGFQHIVSWMKYGTAFQVHDTREFVAKVMPNYFDQTRYESFRRQLNLYGFDRVSKGPNRGIMSHSCLIKSDRSLCQNITRQPNKIAGQNDI
jgi:hypothetical protein